MSTFIEYQAPPPQVSREHCCYKVPGDPRVLQGFLMVTYLGDEEVSRTLEALDGNIVPQWTLTECPVGGTTVPNKQVIVLKNRETNRLVYAVNTINNDGTVTTTYWTIDGSAYDGNVSDLDIHEADSLVYGAAIVFCVDGQDTVTRTDVWDGDRTLIVSIWQNERGQIIPEPTGALKAGACDFVLDTEVVTQIDNHLTNNSPNGTYTTFYRVNVHGPDGAVVYSSTKRADGTSYNPDGRITAAPIVPPLTPMLVRLSDGQIWQGNSLVQSVAWSVEYANPANTVELTAANGTTVIDRTHYRGGYSVDGAADPNIESFKVQAFGSARVMVSWMEQPALVEVFTNGSGGDPLDAQIPVPNDLLSGGND